MTYYPHNPLKRAAVPTARAHAPMRQLPLRDILWNQPVFKAPALANPRVAFDPLPFTATRITRRRTQG